MSARRAAIAAAATILVTAVAALLWRTPSSSEPAPAAAIIEAQAIDSETQLTDEPVFIDEPTTTSTEAPTATLTHLVETPEQAAVRFLELTEEVVAVTPEEAAAIQRSVASAASADRLAASVLITMSQLQDEFPEGITVEIAPLGVTSTQVGDGWEVEVWYAAVATYGDIVAIERWETATYRVVLEDGEWRMDDLATVEGPVPTRPESVFATPTDLFIEQAARFSDDGIKP
ncbi:MAG: hypothetical protein R2770_00760 [Acidimicrobiales bacterium]